MPTPRMKQSLIEEAVEVYRQYGVTGGAALLGIPTHTFAYRVDKAVEQGLIQRLKTVVEAVRSRTNNDVEGRLHHEITDGHVLIGSDAHYYPNIASTAHRAFVRLCGDIRPVVAIQAGDVFDGSTISRHPRIGWDNKPTVAQEVTAVDERLTEIEDAVRHHNLYWTLGNHDARYETFLAAHAPEFQGVDGFTLKSRFPAWKPCWSVWINNDTVIKHRFKSGLHAPHNNTIWAGKTIITGHLHSQKVMPISDYNGTRWGVDCGTLATPYGPQFQDYTEDNPKNWRSGFVLLTYWKGILLQPQLITVMDEEKGLVNFGTQVFEV